MSVKERIQALLEKELQKLELLSYTSPEPLSVSGVKALDVLIKAWRSFSDPAKSSDKPSPDDPANSSTEDLLNGLGSDTAKTEA